MTTPEDGGTVRYNVKDLLGAMDKKLDRIVESLALKADRSDVHELKGRVFALEKQAEVARMLATDREEGLRLREDKQDRTLSRKQQLATTFAGVASTVALFISATHWFHLHG